VVAVETIETCAALAPNVNYSDRADKPTVSLSRRRIFILAAEVPVAALSPTDTILVM
jgi:hypothetical protein